jgi:hypothetical protein
MGAKIDTEQCSALETLIVQVDSSFRLAETGEVESAKRTLPVTNQAFENYQQNRAMILDTLFLPKAVA